jgi:hypothetical protein
MKDDVLGAIHVELNIERLEALNAMVSAILALVPKLLNTDVDSSLIDDLIYKTAAFMDIDTARDAVR